MNIYVCGTIIAEKMDVENGLQGDASRRLHR